MINDMYNILGRINEIKSRFGLNKRNVPEQSRNLEKNFDEYHKSALTSSEKNTGGPGPFNPADNIKAGVSHLKDLLEEYNWDYKKALSAYNAGRGAVKKFGGVPEYKETKEYVNNVIKGYLDNK